MALGHDGLTRQTRGRLLSGRIRIIRIGATGRIVVYTTRKIVRSCRAIIDRMTRLEWGVLVGFCGRGTGILDSVCEHNDWTFVLFFLKMKKT
jgi:hypothetical protein